MSLVKRKKQQQQVEPVETGKELELFNNSKAKKNKTDDTITYPPVNIGISLEEKPIRFFIGTRQYQLVKQHKQLDYYYNYMQFVLNLMYGYLDYNSYIQDILIIRNYKSIIAYAFQAIIRYNYIVAPYKMNLHEFDEPVLLGEPVKYIINKFDNITF